MAGRLHLTRDSKASCQGGQAPACRAPADSPRPWVRRGFSAPRDQRVARRQKSRLLHAKRHGTANAKLVHRVGRGKGIAPRSAGLRKREEPGPSSNHALLPGGGPRGIHLPLRRIVPKPVHHPFRHVACHVQRPAPVCPLRIAPHRRRERIAIVYCRICLGVAALRVTAVQPTAIEGVTPRVYQPIRPPCRVLPLSLGWQLGACPFAIDVCLVPGDTYYRLVGGIEVEGGPTPRLTTDSRIHALTILGVADLGPIDPVGP